MANHENVVVALGGADDTKVFRITKKSALDAEKWAWRMCLALKGAGGPSPQPEEMELMERLGMVGVAMIGLRRFLAADVRWQDMEPLLDELMACVSVVRDPNHPAVATPLLPTDLQEIRTVGWLRSEVLRVHTGFSAADALSRLLSLSGTSAPPRG